MGNGQLKMSLSLNQSGLYNSKFSYLPISRMDKNEVFSGLSKFNI